MRSKGCQKGALTPIFQQETGIVMDTFLESCQEGMKISYKGPGISHVSNSLLKQRHMLGNEIVPWTVACIKISFVSLSLPLCPTNMCHMGRLRSGVIFFFFLFWPPQGIWSSQARHQSGAAVVTYATSVAMPDP